MAQPAAPLSSFDGRDVIAASVAVTNAGDGLSKALGVDPNELHIGEQVYVVLECEVAKIRHEEVKDTKSLRRVHVLRAGTATFLDDEAVRDALDKQRLRIEEAAGVHQLPYTDEGDGDGDV